MVRIRITDRDLHTLLAALRFYQELGQGGIAERFPWIDDLASNGGKVTPLDCGGIDALCERLNFSGPCSSKASA